MYIQVYTTIIYFSPVSICINLSTQQYEYTVCYLFIIVATVSTPRSTPKLKGIRPDRGKVKPVCHFSDHVQAHTCIYLSTSVYTYNVLYIEEEGGDCVWL